MTEVKDYTCQFVSKQLRIDHDRVRSVHITALSVRIT